MVEASLVVGGLLSLATSALYGFVGWKLSKRSVNGDSKLAHRMFLAWWFGLAGTTFLAGAQTLLYAADALSVTLFEAARQLDVVFVLGALLGLLYYLVYLYTGSKRSLIPLALAYGGIWLYLTYLYAARPFEGLTDNGWTVFGEPSPFTTVGTIVLLLGLIGPQIGAAIALLVLFFKVENATQRYRLALVSTAILVWFGMAFIGAVAGWGALSWWPLFDRLLGLSAATATLAAYHPPAIVKARYGILAIGDER